jgi:ATP-binding cassette subfamily B protein
MASRLQRAASQLPYLPRALTLVWAAAPAWAAAWGALLVAQGLRPAATVYLTKARVDSLVRVVGAGLAWATVRPVLMTALLMGDVMLVSQLPGSVAGTIRMIQEELVGDYMRSLVHRQSVSLDLAFYDLPDYYDHLHRARDQAAYGPISLLENIGDLIQNGITLVTMAAILLPYGAWLPVALLASTLPALYVVVRS